MAGCGERPRTERLSRGFHEECAVPGTAFGPSAEGWLHISRVSEEAVLADDMARIAEFFRPA